MELELELEMELEMEMEMEMEMELELDLEVKRNHIEMCYYFIFYCFPKVNVLASAVHILKLERYRED